MPEARAPPVPLRLWASYGAFLAALGILVMLGSVWLLGVLPWPPLAPLLAVAFGALGTWAAVSWGGLPRRLLAPSLAAVAGTTVVSAMVLFAAMFAHTGCGPFVSDASWRQPGLFGLAAAAGAEVQPPRFGLESPWPSVTVLGVAVDGGWDHSTGTRTGFYLRTDYRGDPVLTHGGAWDNGTAQRLRELAARITSQDPARWEGPLRGGQPVAVARPDRLPALLADLANRSGLEPSGTVGLGTLTEQPWRLDLAGAVARLDRLRVDPFGGAAFDPEDAGTEDEARQEAARWLGGRGWPFQPEGFRTQVAVC
jgi:hypothetical protein